MNQVDLHAHTTASDGSLSPAMLVSRASRLALKVIAITDHDTVAGVAEGLAAGQAAGVEVIPGVEINTDVPGAEVHVLGYFVDHTHGELNTELARIRAAGDAVRGLGMRFNAGHALNYHNVQPVAALPGVRELHIGHSIVSRAMFVGMREAVREMKRLMREAAGAGSGDA